MDIAQAVVAFVFGVAFVVALLVLAIKFPNPALFQYNVFRIVLALAAAGVAAGLDRRFIRASREPGGKIKE